jgi:hypothetical protein
MKATTASRSPACSMDSASVRWRNQRRRCLVRGDLPLIGTVGPQGDRACVGRNARLVQARGGIPARRTRLCRRSEAVTSSASHARPHAVALGHRQSRSRAGSTCPRRNKGVSSRAARGTCSSPRAQPALARRPTARASVPLSARCRELIADVGMHLARAKEGVREARSALLRVLKLGGVRTSLAPFRSVGRDGCRAHPGI